MFGKSALACLFIAASFVGCVAAPAKSHQGDDDPGAQTVVGAESGAADAGESEKSGTANRAPAMLRGNLRDQGASIVPRVQFADPKRFSSSDGSGADSRHSRFDGGIDDSALFGGQYYRGTGSAWSTSPRYTGRAKGGFLKGNGNGVSLNRQAQSTLLSGQAKTTLYKAFIKMNCQEFTLLNANYYSVDRNYKLIAKRSATDTTGNALQPEIPVPVGKSTLRVRMCLPGLQSSSVQLYTDGRHLIAIDPNTNDTWHWQQPSAKSVGSGSWSRLTHIKK